MNTDRLLEIARRALEAVENLGAEQPDADNSIAMFTIANDALFEIDALETKGTNHVVHEHQPQPLRRNHPRG